MARYVFTALVLFVIGCFRNEPRKDAEFAFIVYPGSHYLGNLTEVTKQAHKLIRPQESPTVLLYDTDSPLEDVAAFYAKAYEYPPVAPDSTNNLSEFKPVAYYRTGDLRDDNQAAKDLLSKLNLNPDVSGAQGSYRAAEILARPNRPRVTVQRPYFDVTTSRKVDRTLIFMSR